ncbi:LRR receptor-like serine/threonine-protein kinase GSO1 [Balamuthia mandrillaris]
MQQADGLQHIDTVIDGLQSERSPCRCNLYNRGLTALPISFGRIAKLTSCNLSANLLTALPSDSVWPTHRPHQLQSLLKLAEGIACGVWPALISLYVDNNKLVALPSGFGQLSLLKFLDIRSNELETLPSDFGGLSLLRSLDLSSNQLTGLPSAFNHCTALTYLDLSFNSLIALPSDFGHFPLLKSLNLSSNQLTLRFRPPPFPDPPGSLQQQTDSLTLWAIPRDFGELTALKRCHLERNPLAALPPSALPLLPVLRRTEHVFEADKAEEEAQDKENKQKRVKANQPPNNNAHALTSVRSLWLLSGEAVVRGLLSAGMLTMPAFPYTLLDPSTTTTG